MTTQLSKILHKILPVISSYNEDMQEPGQFLFSTDTGRLFIGAGADTSDHNYSGRATVPGRNVEVLTEAALDTLERMLNALGVATDRANPVAIQMLTMPITAEVVFEGETTGEVVVGGQTVVVSGPFSASFIADGIIATVSFDGTTLTQTGNSTLVFSIEDQTNILVYDNPDAEITMNFIHH